jgi:hypothetical protein
MPLDADLGAETANLAGLYGHLRDRAIEHAGQVDSRVEPAGGDPRFKRDYAPSLDAGGRRRLSDSGPVVTQAERIAAAFRRGEPQVIAVARFPFKRFPAARKIPFLDNTVCDDREEADERAYLVRVYPNDDLEVAQTVGQHREEAELITRGYTRGEIDENGDYWPLAQDPATGKWERIIPS